MTNLQIMVKEMAKFCKDCPKNNTVEWQTSFDRKHCDYVMYGRIRVAEPEFNNKKFDEVKRLGET